MDKSVRRDHHHSDSSLNPDGDADFGTLGLDLNFELLRSCIADVMGPGSTYFW